MHTCNSELKYSRATRVLCFICHDNNNPIYRGFVERVQWILIVLQYDSFHAYYSCRVFNSADVCIIAAEYYGMCVCVQSVMFNQRECRPEIPQCHMAETWSPLGPFVLCQKQGSPSVFSFEQVFFLPAALMLL